MSRRKQVTLPPFQKGLTREQIELLEQRKHCLKEALQFPPEMLPKLAFQVTCFECEETSTFAIKGRKMLSPWAIYQFLLLQGWNIAGKGYQCPACQQAWAEAVADFIRSQDRRVVDAAVSSDVQNALSLKDSEVMCYCCHRLVQKAKAQLVGCQGDNSEGEMWWCGYQEGEEYEDQKEE
jgi:hypothetical protein